MGLVFIILGSIAVTNAINDPNAVGTAFGMLFGYAIIVLGAILWLLVLIFFIVYFIRNKNKNKLT